MNEFYEKAIERLRDDKGLSGNKERAMAPAVREALEKKGYTFLSAEPAYIPSTYTALPEDAADKMTRLMDLLDDCDDVQGFWHNWEM